MIEKCHNRRFTQHLNPLVVGLLLASVLAGCSGASGTRSAGAQVVEVQVSQGSGLIKLNQLGFLPQGQKLAVVPDVPADRFTLVRAGTDEEVYRGLLSPAAVWEPAQESVKLADFSELTQTGSFQLRVAGVPDSVPFVIAADAYQSLNAAAIKAYYFSRSGIPLEPEHAGIYARPEGHPDTQVLVHASAADDRRPEGTVISSPKGWYDAGDYNKYIVNSGITTYTLLAAFEHFPEEYLRQNLNIPESGNGVPDLLDEVYWNLDWMLSMQDPNDGGVYHKLTNKNFDPVIMPHEANEPRYVVQKTTGAALNFAAVMAVASRAYADYEHQYPGLSARMRRAAEAAWVWARANPDRLYRQPEDISTGTYGDRSLADEFVWAAAELFITTGDDRYYADMNLTEAAIGVPSWSNVSGLPWISLSHHLDKLSDDARQLVRTRVDQLAQQLQENTEKSAYRVAMQPKDFIWGSNAVALNQAMMLLQGYRLTSHPEYLASAQSLLDYTLGRNPVDYSFVTGFGYRTPMHIHHRPSEADGIVEPVPGLLAGGPQPGQQDIKDCPVAYPSAIPARSYLDHWCSYASNEIAINWNAPLVYVSGAIQSLVGEL
jgi:endoglucanase